MPTSFALTFNPGLYDTLPLMVALEKGYFTGAHLDVEVTKISAPHGTLIPSLARGDIDVAPQTLTPAFFNQLGAGFGIKILALMSGSHKGWNDTVWDVVREDVWEAKQIRKPSDLRGKSVPKPIGNAVDFMLVKTLAKGGLNSRTSMRRICKAARRTYCRRCSTRSSMRWRSGNRW